MKEQKIGFARPKTELIEAEERPRVCQRAPALFKSLVSNIICSFFYAVNTFFSLIHVIFRLIDKKFQLNSDFCLNLRIPIEQKRLLLILFFFA